MKTVDTLAAILLVIGGVNWGLYGIMSFDLLEILGGGKGAPFTLVLYSLVATSALYQVLGIKGIWSRWGIAYEKN
jgi:hypothetical protein